MSIHLFDKDQNAAVFAAGQTVFSDGEPGDHMYAVLSGAVEIIIRGKIVETVETGGVFGEMALVDDRVRAASAIVKSEARLVAIDKKRFMFLVQQNPFFALQIMTIMSQRLRRMGQEL
jgi:CRP/FNR family transcriptional regulator, cyclic AMP receptor protein